MSSFLFTAAGTRADVLAQLAAPGTDAEVAGSPAGTAARDLAAAAVAAEGPPPPEGPWELRYVVKCAGHDGDALPGALSLTVEAFIVPAVTAVTAGSLAPPRPRMLASCHQHATARRSAHMTALARLSRPALIALGLALIALAVLLFLAGQHHVAAHLAALGTVYYNG